MPKSNVRMINGVEITGTPNVGDVPVATSATAAAWASGALLAASAVILAPGSSTRNTIESTGNFVSLRIRQHLGQTQDLTEWFDDSGNLMAYLTAPGSSPRWVVNSNPGGFSPGATAIGGTSDTASGVRGTATSTGIGIDGNSAAGHSGYFRSSNSANTASTVAVQQKGASVAHLFDFLNDAGAVLTYFDKDGNFSGSVVGGGSVTSVGLSLPAELTVSGSPVTSAGTLTAAWAMKAANLVFAGPTSGGAATPTFRSLVSADIPNNAADTTGKSAKTDALTSASTVVDVSASTAPTAGQVLTATSGSAATWQTPSGGFTPNIVIRKATTGTWTVYSGATAISTAVAASSSGDLVWVGPGTFNDKNFLKNGVNLHFEGSVVTYTDSANGAIFDDSATGANGAVTCVISGTGQFTNSGTGTGNFAVNLSNASTVTISAQLLKSTATDALELNAGTLILPYVDTVSTTHSNNIAIYVNSPASLSGRVRTLTQTSGSGGWGLYSSGTTSIVFQDVTTTGKGIYSDFGTLDVELHTLSSSNGVGLHINGSGTFRILANSISTGASGAYAARLSNGTVYLQAKSITTAGINAAIWLNGATAYITADVITTTSPNEPTITIDSGTCAVAAKTISTTSSAQYAVGGSGGTLRLLGGRLVNSGTNGVACQAGGQTLILENAVSLISAAGATDGIKASSAQNVKLYGFVCSNKAKNANVTFQVGPAANQVFSDANVV